MYKILGAFVFATACLSATISMNTGQGALEGFNDPNWTILSAPAGTGMNTSGAAYILTNPVFWAAPPAGVNYISAGDCDASETANCGAGTYRFTTQFNLTAGEVPFASLQFQAAADNEVQVYLNNVLLLDRGVTNDPSNHTGFNSLSPQMTVTSGFLTGANTLELRVLNAGSFTGGVLTGQVNPTPEPGSIILAGAGLLGLVVARRRRAARRFNV